MKRFVLLLLIFVLAALSLQGYAGLFDQYMKPDSYYEAYSGRTGKASEENGGTIYTYDKVTLDDFLAYGDYLEGQGLTVADTQEGDSLICFTIVGGENALRVAYSEVAGILAEYLTDAAKITDKERESPNININTQRFSISAGLFHTVGLYTDGTAVAVGFNENGQCSVSDWSDIVSVSAGPRHTVGLREDGTAVAVGYNENGQCSVSDWYDLISVSAGLYHTVGLCADGTAVAVGNNTNDQCYVSDWRDIVSVSAGAYHTAGLRSDGTAVAVGSNEFGKCDVLDWRDIISISAGDCHTVGLRADGTAVAVGYNKDGQCNVSDWRDLISVSAGAYHTVGLHTDGTVVAVGRNKDGQCDVSDWRDIVSVSAGANHTVGLRIDGTVVAAASNKHGQCSVSNWTNIGLSEWAGRTVNEATVKPTSNTPKPTVKPTPTPEEQNNIGVTHYNNGEYSEAVKWYRLSAEQGNTYAQSNLGCCYYYGEGVDKDYREAVKWYRLSAEHGNEYAQSNLGFCYRYGYGVIKDVKEAVKWYTLAAEQGNEKSKKALNDMGYTLVTGKDGKLEVTLKSTPKPIPKLTPTPTPKSAANVISGGSNTYTNTNKQSSNVCIYCKGLAKCRTCGGRGDCMYSTNDGIPCVYGKLYDTYHNTNLNCPRCGGSGKCKDCGGSGRCKHCNGTGNQ